MIGKKINQLATELAPATTDLTIIGDPDSGVSKKITLAQLGAIFSGAVSFYTNLAAFPVVGDINVIYCAKDTQKLYLWSGSAYVEVFPSQALLNTYQLRSEKGVSNGYASLDSGGKVPISQLPSSIMEYKGTWNASTNTPTLANGTGDTGDVYICNVAGTVNFGAGPITFAVGDYTIYSGSIWQRSSGAVGTVTSVAVSRSGDALAITGSPVTTSGTINVGFAGNSTQYINGAGNLVTFPGVINEAQNLITEVYNKTGATLTKGTVVYINGGQGNLPTITKALATGDSTSAQTYGIVRNDITNNNNGYVVVAGRISDLDTQAYTEGTQLYLSSTTAGAYTSTKQYAPNHLVYVGIVVRAHPTQGVIEVKIQNGYELDELHNVAAQTPSNNDGIFWEASTSLWKNKSIATILGGTPVTGSGNVNAIPKFTANSVLGNSVMEDDGNFVSMRGLKINAVAGVGNTINFQQGSGITAAGLGYSTIGAASTTGFAFYIDQNTTSRSFILDTSTITSATQLTYSLPSSSGTLALASQLTGGTVTSVGLSSATSGVTIGSTPITTSGTITLAIATASGSQQGLLSSTDWTTFNNKQNALTNPVTGTGTTNYLPKFTGASTIGDSTIQTDGTGNLMVGSANAGNAGSVNISVGLAGTTSGGLQLWAATNQTHYIQFGDATSGAAPYTGYIGYAHNNDSLIFGTSTSTKMTLNASGNLGLGVTPSAGGLSGYVLFEIANGGASIYGGPNQNLNGTNISWSGGTASYKISNFATIYNQQSGQHQWYIAPSGTAGNAISFTQAMTLNASGNLSIGNTNDTYKLDVTGTGRFTGTLTAATLTDGFITIGAAQINRTSATVEMQFAGSGDVRIFGNTAYPIRFIAGTGAATFSGNLNVTVPNTPEVFLTHSNTSRTFLMAVDGSNAFFRANSTNNILFQVAGGTNVMALTSGGNVGIGTTNPFARLSVVQDITTTAEFGSFGQFTLQGATNSNKLLSFGFNTATDAGFIQAMVNGTSYNNLLLNARGGNVGIGTTSPSSLLHLLGGILKIEAASSSAAYLQLSYNGATNGQSGYIGYDPSANMTFFTNNTERMRITSGGRVGILNTAPQGILEAGIVNANSTNGGLFFSTFNIPVDTWSTVFVAPSNDQWNAITEFTWTSTGDYNRSGAAYMRWAYESGAATLGVVYTLFNNSQNATATFRKSGNNIQIYITGGANNYFVQVRIQGSKAQ